MSTQPQWVRTQKKTFTKWANVQLNGEYVINDVEKDLNDGLILISLFQALTKKKVEFRYTKKPKMRIQCVENTKLALQFIIQDGIKLVNIGPDDIVDGKLNLILGLLWTLILKYQIAKNKVDASKNALLEWVNSKVSKYKVTNFSQDWNDGNTLSELIFALEPDFLTMEQAESKPAGLDRIKQAEDIAAEKMEIPAIIDPEDMALPEPDELSVMAYISYYRHYETEKLKRLGEEERLAAEKAMKETPDPSKCIMSGPGLKTGEVLIPQEFTVEARNCFNERIPNGGHTFVPKVTDPEGNDVNCDVKDNEDGTYLMTYLPLVPGKHTVEVSFNEKPLKQSPVSVLINPAVADASHCYADGEGVDKTEAGKGEVTFTIHACNKLGTPIPATDVPFKVKIVGPNGDEIPCELTDNKDGTYTGKYAPVAGIDTVHIVLNNEPIKDAPYKCKVLQDPSTACIEQSYAYGPGVDGGAKIDQVPVFRIQGVTPEGTKCTKGGDKFKVIVTDPEGKTQEPSVKDNNNGKYDVRYKAKVPGIYNVAVQLLDPENSGEYLDIKGSVYHPEILNGIDPDKCTVTGEGIEKPNDVDDNIFTITAKDSKGEKMTEGGAPFQVCIAALKPSTKKHKQTEEEPDEYSDDGIDDIAEDEDDDCFNALNEADGIEEQPTEEKPAKQAVEGEEGLEIPEGATVVPQYNKGDIPVTVIDNGDGTYDCHYKTPNVGKIKIRIALHGDKVARSPYTLNVIEGPDPDETGVENFCFTIIAKNRRGQVLTDGKAKLVVTVEGPEGPVTEPAPKSKHLGEGKYFIRYALPKDVKGIFNVHCKVNRRDIQGSPFKQTVN